MASEPPRKILVVFYRTRGSAEVVRDWLHDLAEADRNAIGQDLMRVQYRWPVGMPLCRALGDGLWEVRSALPSNRIARVLFSVHQAGFWHFMASSKRARKRRPTTWRSPAAANVNLRIEGDNDGQKSKKTPQHAQAQHAR